MNYNLNPQAVPWKDSISHAIQALSRVRSIRFRGRATCGFRTYRHGESRVLRARNGQTVTSAAMMATRMRGKVSGDEHAKSSGTLEELGERESMRSPFGIPVVCFSAPVVAEPVRDVLPVSASQNFDDFKNNLGSLCGRRNMRWSGCCRWRSLKPGETLYDLGCGDGRILITAVADSIR